MKTSDQELSATQERFQTIYTTLREHIALLDYAPGERLSEEELAEAFGVSRTPIRRVLSRLEAEGLLESRHGVGTFVTKLDLNELREVYQLRKELVGLIGILKPNSPSAGIVSNMKDFQKKCLEVAGSENPKKVFAQINMAVFEEIMQLVGNKPLRDTLEWLFYRTARMWLSLTTDEAIIDEADVFYHEIGEMVRFLEAGDVDSVAHLRRCHISMAFKRLETYVEKTEKD